MRLTEDVQREEAVKIRAKLGVAREAWFGDQGGLQDSNEPAKFRTLFQFTKESLSILKHQEVLEGVFTRLSGFEFDYERDEIEARAAGKPVHQMNPLRHGRVKLPLVESYNLRINVERGVNWLKQRIAAQKLKPLEITA